MGWPLAFAAASFVVSAAGTYLGHRNGVSQNNQQAAWSAYNTHNQYLTDTYNTATQLAIANFNAAMQQKSGELSASTYLANAKTNAMIIAHTADYNDKLMAEEERKLWEAWELDDLLYSIVRKQEKGIIEAAQAASGTLMGEGSNADVVASQMAQGALDRLVMQHNAQLKAGDIINSRLQNAWQSDLEIKKVLWEGNLNAIAARSGANLQGIGQLGSAMLAAQADSTTAELRRQSGIYGGAIQATVNNTQNNAQLASGLFGAASSAISTYYSLKTPTPQTPSTDMGNTSTAGVTGSSSRPIAVGGRAPYTLNTPGTSLLGASK